MEEKVYLRSIFLALLTVIIIMSLGLTLYFLFKDNALEIAMIGLIFIFASMMSLLLFPPFIIRIFLKKREKARKE